MARLSWTPLPDGRVRQFFEQSGDGVPRMPMRVPGGAKEATVSASTLFSSFQKMESVRAALAALFPHTGHAWVIGVTGAPGTGKSTLVNLIPRFYDPYKGNILIDNNLLPNVQLKSLRNLLGIVTQDSILFNDTVLNNIAFGKPEATNEEVLEAAKIANAHEFIINLENGYDTNIGDGGNKLSGGQKQRLSIARAILKNPPVLILDEATSALDTESEKLVQEALTNLMKNRTSLVIAHRLSTIQNADLIVVLENGEIVESGAHHQLIKNRGLYSKLIDMQSF